MSKSRIDTYRFNEGLTKQYLDQKTRCAVKKKKNNCSRWIQRSSNASCEECCQENEYWSCSYIKRNDIKTLYVVVKMPFKDWLKSSYSKWLLAEIMLLFLQEKYEVVKNYPVILRPSDQINPKLVANVFKKYCILDSMNGTHTVMSTKKNLKIGKTLKMKKWWNTVKRMTIMLECKKWKLI